MRTHLDLFSGIGGFALAAGWAEYTTIGFCEIDPFCQRVLRKHWPNVPVFGDIRELDAGNIPSCESGWWGCAHLLTAGFPCQDVSQIGLRTGINGERSSLFSEAVRLADDIRPEWILLENTPGLRHRGLGDVLRELAEIGYDAVWDSVPASAVGAPHQRERVWIIANAKPERLEGFVKAWTATRATLGTLHWKEDESTVLGMDDGFPGWVDQVKALGNSIVPQVAYLILLAMDASDTTGKGSR
jgi:DNA (cytosine-5)-methyltransferase 1